MSNTGTVIVVAVVIVVVALIAFLIVRRQRYIRALRGRGWTFESSPVLAWVLDHHAPPFGLGFVRDVDEAISGTTTTGVPFRVFEYNCAEAGPKFDQRLASLGLRTALPDLFVSAGPARAGVRGGAGRPRPQPDRHRGRSDLRAGRAVPRPRGHRRLRAGGPPHRPERRRQSTGRRRCAQGPRRTPGLPRRTRAGRAGPRFRRPGPVRDPAAASRVRLLRPSRLATGRPRRQPDPRLRPDHGRLRARDREGRPRLQRRPAGRGVHPPLEDPAHRDLHRLRGPHPDAHGHRAALRDRHGGLDALRLAAAVGRRRLGRGEGAVRERGVQRAVQGP